MNIHRFQTEVEKRVMARLRAREQAQRDVGPHGLAYDGSAEEIYQAELADRGISRRETDGLPASALAVLFRNVSRPGLRGASGMAFDASEGNPTLTAILKDIPAPRRAY